MLNVSLEQVHYIRVNLEQLNLENLEHRVIVVVLSFFDEKEFPDVLDYSLVVERQKEDVAILKNYLILKAPNTIVATVTGVNINETEKNIVGKDCTVLLHKLDPIKLESYFELCK